MTCHMLVTRLEKTRFDTRTTTATERQLLPHLHSNGCVAVQVRKFTGEILPKTLSSNLFERFSLD